MGITNISDPLILVRNADGQTPDGIPYYDFSRLVTGQSLDPRGKTSLLSAEFFNPNRVQFTYDLIFLGKLNEAPEILSLPETEAYWNREYLYDVHAIDPNNDTLTYELIEAPVGMTIDSRTGVVRWTPSNADRGSNTIEVRVSDNRQGVTSQRYTLLAGPAPANRAPVFVTIPVAVAEVGLAYPYITQAIDADRDPLAYRLVSGPAGMTVNANTGAIIWTPAAIQVGSQEVLVEVSDGRGATAEQAFTLLVVTSTENTPPVIISSPPTIARQTGFTYQVVAYDADNSPLTYRLLTFPAGMTVNSAGLIEWTPPPGPPGPASVLIEVLDDQGGRDTQNLSLSVLNNRDPAITSNPNRAAQTNAQYVHQVTATDPDGDTLTFELLDAPRGMSIGASSGLIQWNVTASAFAQESVTVAVNDGRGGSFQQQFLISVAGGQTSALNLDPYFVSAPPRWPRWVQPGCIRHTRETPRIKAWSMLCL